MTEVKEEEDKSTILTRKLYIQAVAKCFLPGTLFRRIDGCEVRIDDLLQGDEVQAPHSPARVSSVSPQPEMIRPVVSITLTCAAGRFVVCMTDQHRVVSRHSLGYQRACSLRRGDILCALDGDAHVDDVNCWLLETTVYEVVFNSDHSAYMATPDAPTQLLATYGADEAWITLEWSRCFPPVRDEHGQWIKDTEHLSFHTWAQKHVTSAGAQIRGSTPQGVLVKSQMQLYTQDSEQFMSELLKIWQEIKPHCRRLYGDAPRLKAPVSPKLSNGLSCDSEQSAANSFPTVASQGPDPADAGIWCDDRGLQGWLDFVQTQTRNTFIHVRGRPALTVSRSRSAP